MTDIRLRPIPLTDPAHGRGGLPLAGGWVRFTHLERLARGRAPEIVAAADLPEAVLAPFLAPRAAIAGLSLDRPRLMGIVNVTPDSFSDGGQHGQTDAAVARGQALLSEGADLLDIGGESTRPGAAELPAEAEAARVVPVIAGLRAAGVTAPVSLDTRKSAVAKAGLDAGADILNDVSGLRFDPALAGVAAAANAPLILMHSIGTPETMQDMAATAYDDVLLDAYDALAAAVAQAEAAGVPRARILVDPGIGFGKTLEQNMALLSRIGLFHGLGCGILLGVSRKGMIGRLADEPVAARRGPGSAAIGLWAVAQGVQMLRVHDMDMHRQALALWQALVAR
ncbi:dihydropteroate synthase [Roseicyclus persicicus]|uniref:Dihydropteroate synthase n=1 Tax=Roseicyclus persicicus TaxID=2650661 RepID=A0A7X6GX20_9RHOB|nr:dihydropteroate synthase [Roseibacterium persicicum]NKX43893.1 dihydropteroate synthase [Roseibacterium persicicum]